MTNTTPCLECDSTGKYKVSKKTYNNCPACDGSGTNPLVMDSSGKEPILPGQLARIVPKVIGYDDKGNELKSDGYKGRVRFVKQATKGIVVEIIALPELSPAGQKTFNHGLHSTRPEYIRMMKSNANLERLKQYREKKKLKEETAAE